MKSQLAALFLSLLSPNEPQLPTEVAPLVETIEVRELKKVPEDNRCLKKCTASERAVDTIILFEGYSPVIYKDVAGYETIGHGHLIRKGEKFTVPMLPQSARDLLIKDMGIAVKDVNTWVGVRLWQEQFDALVSWTFNLGGGALKKSTMLKRVNAEVHRDVPPEMLKWNKAGGKIYRGLTIRRDTEGKLYSEGTARSQAPKK